MSLRVGFEPTREDPNGFQVHRLNHSAIAAVESGAKTSTCHKYEDKYYNHYLINYSNYTTNPLSVDYNDSICDR